jgi:DNA-binding CsgD family transcriptional regulator
MLQLVSTVAVPKIVQRLAETLDVPLFLLDENLDFLWLNARALRFLEHMHAADGGEAHSSAKISGRKADRIRHGVGDALAAAGVWSGDSARIPVPGTPNTQLRLYRLTYEGRRFISGMIVQQPPGIAESAVSNLSAYGLTKVEKKIAGQLIRGRTAAEIAIENGSALLTVRTHIKRIYSKMGVNCREKMFAQIIGH